jgi:hypothetical protein
MKFLMGILALLVVLGVRQAITDSYVDTVATVSSGGQKTCLEVLGTTTGEEDGKAYVIGNVRNNCSRAVGQTTVVFTVDPESGSRSSGATLYAYVRDLKPGQTRRFKTMFPIPKNRTYHFEGINAF